MVKFNIHISHTSKNEVFIQTNWVKDGNIKNIGDYAQITMSESDAKELAVTLSNVCETVFEDNDYHCTVFMDEEIVDEYDNE